MKDKILDEFVDESFPSYAKKSFNHFLYSIIVFAIFYGLAIFFAGLDSGMVDESIISIIPFLLIFSAFISTILGVIYTIKSMRKKERQHWKKYVGAIGNIVLMIFFLLLIFSIFSDIYENFFQ